jgi:tetratricopeptide (TPR) repeat protein
VLFNLADLYTFLGEHKRAEPLLLRSLAIDTKLFGENDRNLAGTLEVLSIVSRNLGNYAQAESRQLRALEIRRSRLGDGHPETAISLRRFALLRWAQGRSTEALQLLQRAQSIQRRNSERFILSGSESRKQSYLETLADGVFLDVSFSVSVTGQDSATLGLASVLQHKGRALDAVSDSVGRLRRSVRASDRALFDDLAQTAQQLSTLIYQGTDGLTPYT